MNIQKDALIKEDQMPQPTAVVTGAASGIGLALTEELARADYRIVMADIRPDALEEAANSIRSILPDAQLMTVAADVTSADSVLSLAREVEAGWGSPDLLINNAGVIGPIAPTWEGGLGEWELAFGVNVWGVIHSLRAFLPLMIAADRGRVVNIASVASWSSAPMMSAYGATKHAVMALSESTYRELQAQGSSVAVTVVCPTTVRTGLITEIAEGRQGAEEGARVKLLAARDGAASPAEVAAIIVAGIQAGAYLVTTNDAWVVNAAQQRVAIAQGAEPPLDREPPRAS